MISVMPEQMEDNMEGVAETDNPTEPSAPTSDRVAWEQKMQARKERMIARAREEAKPLKFHQDQL